MGHCPLFLGQQWPEAPSLYGTLPSTIQNSSSPQLSSRPEFGRGNGTGALASPMSVIGPAPATDSTTDGCGTTTGATGTCLVFAILHCLMSPLDLIGSPKGHE